MPITPINPDLYHTPESIEAEERAIERILGYMEEASWPKFEPTFRRQYNHLRFNPLTAVALTCGKLGGIALSKLSRRKEIRDALRDIAKEMPWCMPRISEDELKSDAMAAAWHLVHYWLAVLHELPKDSDGFTIWADADFSRLDILRRHKYWSSINSQIQMNGWPLKSDDLAYIIRQIIDKLFAGNDIALVLPDIKIRRLNVAAGATANGNEAL